MDEARAVMTRLTRIEALDAEGAPPPLLLAELRELVREAEAWVRTEPPDANAPAEDALARCRAALATGQVAPVAPAA